MFVVGLLLAAAVAGAVVWTTVARRHRGSLASATATSVASAVPVTPVTIPSGGTIHITSVATFDPSGGPGDNPALASAVDDNDANTAWMTGCYNNAYFGTKQGSGLILHLAGPAHGTLSVSLVNAPWNLQIFAADGVPNGLAGWGQPIAQASSQRDLGATVTLSSSARTLLVLLREVGRDKSCPRTQPFRGGVTEIGLRAA